MYLLLKEEKYFEIWNFVAADFKENSNFWLTNMRSRRIDVFTRGTKLWPGNLFINRPNQN